MSFSTVQVFTIPLFNRSKWQFSKKVYIIGISGVVLHKSVLKMKFRHNNSCQQAVNCPKNEKSRFGAHSLVYGY